MRHIKEAAEMPGIEMLCHNVRGVFDGHFPTAEIHHGGAGSHMHIIELGPFQITHWLFLRLYLNFKGSIHQG